MKGEGTILKLADVLPPILWKDIQRRWLALLDRAPDSSLDWRWAPTHWSLADQIAHVAEVREYWLGHQLLGQPYEDRIVEREGAPPDRNVSADRAVLAQLLRDSFALAERALELPLAEAHRLLPTAAGRAGSPYTVAWAVAHTLEHDSHHHGMAALILRLYAERNQ